MPRRGYVVCNLIVSYSALLCFPYPLFVSFDFASFFLFIFLSCERRWLLPDSGCLASPHVVQNKDCVELAGKIKKHTRKYHQNQGKGTKAEH